MKKIPIRPSIITQGLPKLGNLEAMGNLAGSYLETESKDKHAEAITWLETAAKQNHPYSTYVLGWAYHTGTGIKEDEKLAIKFLEKSQGAWQH